jgi:hypothetical protein
MKDIKVLSFQITLQLQIESHVNLMDMKRHCTTSTKIKANWKVRNNSGVWLIIIIMQNQKQKKIVVC